LDRGGAFKNILTFEQIHGYEQSNSTKFRTLTNEILSLDEIPQVKNLDNFGGYTGNTNVNSLKDKNRYSYQKTMRFGIEMRAGSPLHMIYRTTDTNAMALENGNKFTGFIADFHKLFNT